MPVSLSPGLSLVHAVITVTGPAWTQYISPALPNVKVKYVIENTNGTIVAYMADSTTSTTSLTLQDAITGNSISMMVWSQPSAGGWSWKITVPGNFTTHPAADAVLLALLAGQRTFAGPASTTDRCNDYFSTLGYVLIATSVVVLLLFAWWVYDSVKKWLLRRKAAQHHAAGEVHYHRKAPAFTAV